MVDMKAQYARLKPALDAAFSAVMASGEFTDGPQVVRLAGELEQYLHVQHAFPCANSTDALKVALLALDLPVGAEVVLPAFSDEKMVEVVTLLGLNPTFADVLPDTFTLDPASVEKVMTPATAAILPVHLFGQCAPMEALADLAKQHNLWVVEDTTQALGAVYRWSDKREASAGSMGHMSFTSFFPSKPVAGTGEGGALFTNDAALANKVRHIISNTGSEQDVQEAERKFSPLDTLQAAMLEVKLHHLDAYHAARQQVAQFYDRAFADTELVQTPCNAPYSSHIYQQYTIKVAPELRDGLQQFLRKNHIPSAVYYPKPLHLLEALAKQNQTPPKLPVSERLSKSVLSLPMHSELKEDQLTYICHHVKNYVKQRS